MNSIICSCVRRKYNFFIGKVSTSAVGLLAYPSTAAFFLSTFCDYLFRMAAKGVNETATITLQIGGSNVASSQVFLNKQ